MTSNLTLVSHHLCPYVQRAMIALTEKNVPFERVYVDLANKPDWFLALSPLGKTPVLKVGKTAIFESAVILEYLEDTQPRPIHPADPLRRAEHRSWIEFSSAVLNDIAGLYNAPNAAAFDEKVRRIRERFGQLESRLGAGPYFDGETFSLVDAAFGPVFRYFDAFDRITDLGAFAHKPMLASWREKLSRRPSIRTAVSSDYEARLWRFLEARQSHLSTLIPSSEQPGYKAVG